MERVYFFQKANIKNTNHGYLWVMKIWGLVRIQDNIHSFKDIILSSVHECTNNKTLGRMKFCKVILNSDYEERF